MSPATLSIENTTYDRASCPIVSVEMNPIDNKSLLNINRYDNLTPYNNQSFIKEVQLTTSGDNVFPINYYSSNDIASNYIVTDRVSSSGTPLFYSYELMFDLYSVTESDALIIYKNNDILIERKDYIVEYCVDTYSGRYTSGNGVIHSDYERGSKLLKWGTFKPIDNQIYRARVLLPFNFNNTNDFYTVRYNKFISSQTKPNHSELIELSKLYDSYDFDIIDNSVIYSESTRLLQGGTNYIYIVRDPETIITDKFISNIKSSITDADGNVYTTIIIGNQEWTIENWRSTKLADGTPIPLVSDPTAWAALTTAGQCYHSNDLANLAIYGRLYNWYAVVGLAPAGWRVPTTQDFSELISYLIANGGNYDGTTSGNKIAKSLASDVSTWEPSLVAGGAGNDPYTNNSSGFSALHGGRRDADGNFYGIPYYFTAWPSDEVDATTAYYYDISYANASMMQYLFLKTGGSSIRMVRNIGEASPITTNHDDNWFLGLSTGSFSVDCDGISKKFTISSAASHTHVGVKPSFISNQVIKIDVNPIVLSEYKYPSYNIDAHDGNDGITIKYNGLEDKTNTIASIDRNKGYLLLSKNVAGTSNISITTECSNRVILDTVNLNPAVPFPVGLGSNKVTKIDSVGIALRSVPSNPQDMSLYNIPYYYDAATPTRFYRFTDGLVVNDGMIINNFNDTINTNNSFIPLMIISLNKITPDILKITDARVIGGGITSEFEQVLDRNSKLCYTDMGFYDGEVLPKSGTVIIHIPRSVYTNMVSRWLDSGLFTPEDYTDIDKHEYDQLVIADPSKTEYYLNQLTRGSDTYNDALNRWAAREASSYIDQIIRKYIPANTQYVLLDEQFRQIRLEL